MTLTATTQTVMNNGTAGQWMWVDKCSASGRPVQMALTSMLWIAHLLRRSWRLQTVSVKWSCSSTPVRSATAAVTAIGDIPLKSRRSVSPSQVATLWASGQRTKLCFSANTLKNSQVKLFLWLLWKNLTLENDLDFKRCDRKCMKRVWDTGNRLKMYRRTARRKKRT